MRIKDRLEHKSLIEKMTLEEKASLMSGKNFWNTKAIDKHNIPSIMLTDGPHGIRKQGGKADHLGLNKSLPATCFPTAATLANSWDQKLLKKVGTYLGNEARSERVSVLLGPGLNIKRNPLCGRNFEYFSEDPFVSGKLAGAMIQGIQESGISACPKHYAVNSQETKRMVTDEIVDDRALHEIYLEGFRIAIKDGQPKTIMSSYNKVNGTYANEHPILMNDILRQEFGFKGLVVTDWGGNYDRVSGLKAYNSLEMPSTNGMTDLEIVNAVKAGRLDEGLLDENVDILLTLIEETKVISEEISVNYDEHHQACVEIATESMVLLKNNDHILPLKDSSKRIAIIGDFAKYPRYQGAGSSLIEPTKLDNLLDELNKTHLNIVGYEAGFKRLGQKSEVLKNKALKLSRDSDIVLLFLGLDESSEAEGIDRQHMRLADNQLDLLNALRLQNKKIILLLAGGSPIEMPFVEDVDAILHTYLPGQGGGQAIKKILLGEVNPSGKLAETFPIAYADVPRSKYYPGKNKIAEHRESIYVGYRYYDTVDKPVRYPFGFGLSYTEFQYENLIVEEHQISCTIRNVGQYSGAEIVQLYIEGRERNVFSVKHELKGFKKVYLEPGESKTVIIPFDEHSFSYFNVKKQAWVKDGGSYLIKVGASSRDIRLEENYFCQSEKHDNPYDTIASVYESCEIDEAQREDFEGLLGRKIEDESTNKVLGHDDIIESCHKQSLFGSFLYQLIMLVRGYYILRKQPIKANNVMFVLELPFRSIARMSGGKFNMGMLDGLLLMINGHFFKGLIQMLKSLGNKK